MRSRFNELFEKTLPSLAEMRSRIMKEELEQWLRWKAFIKQYKQERLNNAGRDGEEEAS